MRPASVTAQPPPPERRPAPTALYVALAGKVIAGLLWVLTDRSTAALWFFFGPDVLVLHALFVPSGQGLGRVYTRFETPRPELWLTIDDGPDETDTPQLLDLLDRHGARATFFVIGERAARFPHLIAEIVRRGHEIGHHTHTHPAATFWCATPARLDAELDLALATLARSGVRPRWFRAPVGIKNLLLNRALARRGLHYVGWTIRSGDCLPQTPARFAARNAARLQPGAILLVHEGASVPAALRVHGLALLLPEIARRGFTCVLPTREQLR
jgi:peptidoglycan/xylan/chitin deacetylase (PgdA/CDA1 family)